MRTALPGPHNPIDSTRSNVVPGNRPAVLNSEVDFPQRLHDAVRSHQRAQVNPLNFFVTGDVDYRDCIPGSISGPVVGNESKPTVGGGRELMRGFAGGNASQYLQRDRIYNRQRALR